MQHLVIWILLGLFLTGHFVQAIASQQEPLVDTEKNRVDSEKQTRLIPTPDSLDQLQHQRNLSRQFKALEEYVESKKIANAYALIHQILLSPLAYRRCHSVENSNSGIDYHEKVKRLMVGLDRSAWKEIQVHDNPKAKDVFHTALRERNLLLLLDIAHRYNHTPFGVRALELAQAWFLDRGKYQAAAATGEAFESALKSYNHRSDSRLSYSLKTRYFIALAYRRAGHRRSEEAQRVFEKQATPGQLIELGFSLEEFRAELERTDGAQHLPERYDLETTLGLWRINRRYLLGKTGIEGQALVDLVKPLIQGTETFPEACDSNWALLPYLGGEEAQARAAYAAVLAEQGTSDRNHKALHRTLLEHRNNPVHAAPIAIAALKIDDEAIINDAIKILSNYRSSLGLRTAYLTNNYVSIRSRQALDVLPIQERISIFEAGLRHPSPQIRYDSARSLTGILPDETHSAFQVMLERTKTENNESILGVLLSFFNRREIETPVSDSRLEMALNSSDQRLKVEAAIALAYRNNPFGLSTLSSELDESFYALQGNTLGDPGRYTNLYRMRDIFKALAKLGGKASQMTAKVERIITFLASQREVEPYLSEALLTLTKLDSKNGIKNLLTYAQSPHAPTRLLKAVVAVLYQQGEVGRKHATSTLEKATGENRMAILDALSQLDKSLLSVLWREQLNDTPGHRLTALMAIREAQKSQEEPGFSLAALIPDLVKQLDHSGPFGLDRHHCAEEILRKLGRPAIPALLQAFLNKNQAVVKQTALDILALNSDRISPSERNQLATLFVKGEYSSRESAALLRIVGSVRSGPEVVQTLKDVLYGPVRNSEELENRDLAAEALGRNGKAGMAILKAAMKSDIAAIRGSVVGSLAKNPPLNPEQLEILLLGLSDPNIGVNAWACYAISQIKSVSKETVALLVDAVERGKMKGSVSSALNLLARTSVPEARAAIHKKIKEPDFAALATLQLVATQAGVIPEEAIKVYKTVLQSDRDPSTIKPFIQVLERRTRAGRTVLAESLYPQLERLTLSQNLEIRALSVSTLTLVSKSPRQNQNLIRFVRNKALKLEQRRDALDRLAKNEPNAQVVLPVYIEAIQDPGSEDLREAGLAALAELGDEARPALAQLIEARQYAVNLIQLDALIAQLSKK